MIRINGQPVLCMKEGLSYFALQFKQPMFHVIIVIQKKMLSPQLSCHYQDRNMHIRQSQA